MMMRELVRRLVVRSSVSGENLMRRVKFMSIFIMAMTCSLFLLAALLTLD